MKFDSYISQLSPKKRHLEVIKFVNIDTSVTQSLITVFEMCLKDSSHYMPPANVVQPSSPSDSKDTSDDNSFSEQKVLKTSSPRNVCCVCGKTEGSRKFVNKESCSHRCCGKCRLQPCNKCLNLAHAVAHSRKIAEPQISPRDVDSRSQNSSGASAVDIDANSAAALASPSPTFRQRSNSFQVHTSRSPSKTSAANSSTDSSNSKDESLSQPEDEFTPRARPRRSSSLTRDNRERYSEKRNAEMCVICMDKMTNPKKLDCGHTFCTDCIEAAFAHAAKCPCCGRIFGKLKGDQPTGGTMKVRRSRDDLAGFRGAGSFVIEYEIPSGFQQVCCGFSCLLVKAFDWVPETKCGGSETRCFDILQLLLRPV